MLRKRHVGKAFVWIVALTLVGLLLLVTPGRTVGEKRYVTIEPTPLVDNTIRLGEQQLTPRTNTLEEDGVYENILEVLAYDYVENEEVCTYLDGVPLGGTTGVSGADNDDGTYENIYESVTETVTNRNFHDTDFPPEDYPPWAYTVHDESNNWEKPGSGHTDDGSYALTVYADPPRGFKTDWHRVSWYQEIGPIPAGAPISVSGWYGYYGDGELDSEEENIRVLEGGSRVEVADNARDGSHDVSTTDWYELSGMCTTADEVTEIEIYLAVKDRGGFGGGEECGIRFDDVTLTVDWYRENVQQNITGIPPAENHELQIEYYISGDTEVVSVYLENFSSGGWENVGMLQGGTADSPKLFTYTLTGTDYIGTADDNVHIRYLQLDNDTAQTSLMVDFARVKSYGGIRWEQWITNVPTGRDNYTLQIRGYTSDSENVGVYLRKLGSWEFVDNLTSAEKTIEKNITLNGVITDYLVDKSLVIKYEDLDNADNTQTKMSIDYAAVHVPPGKPELSIPVGPCNDNTPTFEWNRFIYENLEEGPPSGTLENNAYYDPTNKWVRLTEAAENLHGELEYNLNPGDGFVAEFQFLVTSGSSNPADAVWLYAYCTSTPTWEEDAAGGYHFVYDEFGDSTNDQIQLWYDGTLLEDNYLADNDLYGGSWHTAKIIHSGRNTKMYLDGSSRIDYTDLGHDKRGGLFGWGARTSDEYAEHRINDLKVYRIGDAENQSLLLYENGGTVLENVSLDIENRTYTFRDYELPEAYNYRWEITFTNPYSVLKNADNFHIDVTPPGEVENLFEPADNTLVASPVQFRWSKVNDNSGEVDSGINYTLQIDNENNFVELVDEIKGIPDNAYSWTIKTLPPYPNYYWRVLAVDNAGNPAPEWSDNWMFRCDVKPPLPPELYFPVDNELVGTLQVDFGWENLDGKDPPSYENAPDNGKVNFRFEIDDDPDFSSPIHVDDYVRENSYSYKFRDEGTYYWRVTALDNVLNENKPADNLFTIKCPFSLASGTDSLRFLRGGSMSSTIYIEDSGIKGDDNVTFDNEWITDEKHLLIPDGVTVTFDPKTVNFRGGAAQPP